MDCRACGRFLESRRPQARYCDTTCRVNAAKRRKKGVPELQPAIVDAVPVDDSGRRVPATVFEATLDELRDAGRDRTPLGLAALALADRMDQRADTGSALANLAKQLDVTLGRALEGARKLADPVGDITDELEERRRRRASA